MGSSSSRREYVPARIDLLTEPKYIPLKNFISYDYYKRRKIMMEAIETVFLLSLHVQDNQYMQGTSKPHAYSAVKFVNKFRNKDLKERILTLKNFIKLTNGIWEMQHLIYDNGYGNRLSSLLKWRTKHSKASMSDSEMSSNLQKYGQHYFNLMGGWEKNYWVEELIRQDINKITKIKN